MESTMGNAQPHKLYNHQAMGDSELAGYLGHRMKMADVPVLSIEGKLHFMPSQITGSCEVKNMMGGMHHSAQYGE